MGCPSSPGTALDISDPLECCIDESFVECPVSEVPCTTHPDSESQLNAIFYIPGLRNSDCIFLQATCGRRPKYARQPSVDEIVVFGEVPNQPSLYEARSQCEAMDMEMFSMMTKADGVILTDMPGQSGNKISLIIVTLNCDPFHTRQFMSGRT